MKKNIIGNIFYCIVLNSSLQWAAVFALFILTPLMASSIVVQIIVSALVFAGWVAALYALVGKAFFERYYRALQRTYFETDALPEYDIFPQVAACAAALVVWSVPFWVGVCGITRAGDGIALLTNFYAIENVCFSLIFSRVELPFFVLFAIHFAAHTGTVAVQLLAIAKAYRQAYQAICN